MKRIILAALVGVLVVGFLAIPAIAQGTLLFEFPYVGQGQGQEQVAGNEASHGTP